MNKFFVLSYCLWFDSLSKFTIAIRKRQWLKLIGAILFFWRINKASILFDATVDHDCCALNNFFFFQKIRFWLCPSNGVDLCNNSLSLFLYLYHSTINVLYRLMLKLKIIIIIIALIPTDCYWQNKLNWER